VAADYRALVRRRRDGHLVFDLDLVHAGVVAEALEQTRAVLAEGVATRGLEFVEEPPRGVASRIGCVVGVVETPGCEVPAEEPAPELSVGVEPLLGLVVGT